MVVSMGFGMFLLRSSHSSSPTKSKAWRSLLSAARAISGSKRNSSRFSRNLTFFYQILEISGKISRFFFPKSDFWFKLWKYVWTLKKLWMQLDANRMQLKECNYWCYGSVTSNFRKKSQIVFTEIINEPIVFPEIMNTSHDFGDSLSKNTVGHVLFLFLGKTIWSVRQVSSIIMIG